MDSSSEPPSDSSISSQESSPYEEAGPSKRKRVPHPKRPMKRAKTTTTTPHEKAVAAGIEYDTVRSHPRMDYLRRCIDTINRSLPDRSPQRIGKKGDKKTLLNAIFDFLDVPEDERGPVPMSTSQQQYSDTITFGEIDCGYDRALQWAEDSKDTSSVRSFEDCTCPRCRGKPWRPSQDDSDDSDAAAMASPISPKIPPVTSIEGAIQQVEDGVSGEDCSKIPWH